MSGYLIKILLESNARDGFLNIGELLVQLFDFVLFISLGVFACIFGLTFASNFQQRG